MKEHYFTSGTIQETSMEMLNTLTPLRKERKFCFIPKESALLILDMQRYFLDKSSHAYIPSAMSIIPKIKSLSTAFIEQGQPIILTRHLNTNTDAKLMAVWWDDILTEDNPMSQIIPEINYPDSIVLKKSQYDAFYKTPLENMLKEKGITQIVITGVMTHLCGDTTARSAFVRGFTVFFPIDGTATYNKDFHQATFLNLSHGFVTPLLMDDLQNCFKKLKNEH